MKTRPNTFYLAFMIIVILLSNVAPAVPKRLTSKIKTYNISSFPGVSSIREVKVDCVNNINNIPVKETHQIVSINTDDILIPSIRPAFCTELNHDSNNNPDNYYCSCVRID